MISAKHLMDHFDVQEIDAVELEKSFSEFQLSQPEDKPHSMHCDVHKESAANQDLGNLKMQRVVFHYFN